VTDVLDVPTDSIDAQLEHLFKTQQPTAAKVSVVNHPATIDVAFDHLIHRLDGPVVLDMTLSGPSGEDVIGQRGIEALIEHMSQPDLVTLRLQDASLIAGMEIPSLDDAQVAVQRVAQRGARCVLLRCGRLPTHFFDTDSAPPDYAVDLFYDGEDFALFEAPYIAAEKVHGASSAYLLAVLKELSADAPVPDAVQFAKSYVTEALRHRKKHESIAAPDYFWKWADEVSLS
jgi:hydroxymethylpyrimidine kinase/phosphomethylpyrimidine kinase